MNRLSSLLFFCLISFSVSALTVQEGSWKLEISDSNGETNIYKNNALLISKTSAVFKVDDTNYPVISALNFNGATTNNTYSDAFGSGKRIDLIYTQETPALTATHSYYLYAANNYILTELKIESPDVIASNYMSPLTMADKITFLPSVNGTNVSLIVPYDNDAWVTYSSNVFRAGAGYTSYEAGCFYNTTNNNGLVVGSIEHDNWKTGIVSKVNTPNEITSLTVYSGISDNYSGKTPTTRDQLPHGKVKGTTIKSAKVMVGFFDDWRTGMETYGDLNAVVAPKLPWDKGTPFGWNSWGNAQTSLSYSIATGASAFYADYLLPEFSNDGTTYMGLDSYWTNLTSQALRTFVKDCKSRGQKPGIYWTPFVVWSGATNTVVEGTDNKYTYGDIMLKINGQPAQFPGGNKGWALDPTHPGTQMRIAYFVNKWVTEGYEFIKIDFMTHGTFEADSWYDPNITTGMQAYNQGMKYFSEQVDGKMYINLSIAPIFPSQYANGRRIACDTYGAMSETQYALNALTHSWWTDRFYSYNDADYMVFGRFSGNGEYPSGKTYTAWGIGENRARYTSVVTTGLCLMGDDFKNCSDEVRTRVQTIAKNPEINRIAKVGKSFKPVVTAAWNTNQSDLYMNWVADTLYLAAYHFASSPNVKSMTVDYSDLGLSPGKSYVVHELWADSKTQTGEDDTTLTLKIPRSDARVFKIYYDGGTSIMNSAASDNRLKVYPNPCREKLYIDRNENANNFDYELYSLTGLRLMDIHNFSGNSINVNNLDSGSYILVATDTATKYQSIALFIKE